MNKSVYAKICCIFMAFFVLFSSFAFAEPDETSANSVTPYVANAVSGIISYLRTYNESNTNGYVLNSNFLKTLSDSSSLRYITALSRLGFEDNYDSCNAILTDIVEKHNQTTNKSGSRKALYWEEVCLSMMACGYNPHSIVIAGEELPFDLIKSAIWGRSVSNQLDKSGFESVIYGLITLDAYNTIIPFNAKASYTRETLIKQILSYQTEDGSFPSSATLTAPEMTALAITALAPYKELHTVYSGTHFNSTETFSYTVGYSLYNAINYLSSCMDENGEFIPFERESISITSKTIVALCALGLDPLTDTRFIRNDKNPVSVLLSKQNANGEFSLEKYKDDAYENTSFALEALSAYSRYLNGLTVYYNFADTELTSKKIPITFPDIKWASEYYTLENGNVSTDDYEDIMVIIYKTRNGILSDENTQYLNKLKAFADTLYETKLKINRLNEQVEALLSPQTVMGTKSNHSIEMLTREYNTLSIADQKKVENYDALMAKKHKATTHNLFVNLLYAALALVLVVLALTGIFLFIRSTPLWNNFYFKHFVSKQLDDEYEEDDDGNEIPMYEDDFDTNDEMPSFEDEGLNEAALPFEDNDDFFNYEYSTGNELEDENFKIY